MSLKLVKNDSLFQNTPGIYKSLENLNVFQKEAVTADSGPLLVIAGAGSGKTRVLTRKIAYLIEKGESPSSILALTFTNKAANEMKERISALVDPALASGIWSGTFHSVFARILRYEAEKIGYTSSFSIYDSDDSLRVVKKVMNTLGVSTQKMSPQSARGRISWSKNQMITWQEYESSADNSNEKITAQIYAAYENSLQNSNAMDFDDILLNMIHLLKLSDETLKKYSGRFKHILVDEYQDTNRAQYIAVKLLSKIHGNLCVVGDDAQSIYKWRGADIRNILDFRSDYKGSKTVRLEQNYRSTKVILGAADSVIKYNSKQMQKKLWTENPEGEKIELIQCRDEMDEAIKIVNKIKDLAAKDYSVGDFAVLYRTNAQSLALENAFRLANLNYIIVGGISFYKRKEVKDTLAYIRLLMNTKDNEALLRIVNEPPRGLGQVSLDHITNYANSNKIPFFDAFTYADKVPGLQARAVKAAQLFTAFIGNFIAKKDESKPGELILEYIDRSGLLDMYKDIGTSDALDRWNNIQQLLSDISSFFRKNKDATLEDYLQQISLVSEIDEADLNQENVTLMTLHSAKGLEFPVVFISGVEQGLFPLSKADSDPDEMEEERRLMYVGMTRARERLFLSYARQRTKFGELSIQSPSKFINEIDGKYLSGRDLIVHNNSNNVTKQNNINNQSSFAKSKNNEILPDFSEFRVGDKVKHNHFGTGTITGLSGVGPKRQAMIYFASVGGKKRLMLQFAKLEKL